ncbi:hypothetical protein MTR67_012826 [Solanum verrucosum]|uniref:Uncharacterized protein n=1 Tax=Solanum verrucosum TaxID=315347 RepID=A0AAF0Q9Y8_SOLVR|nr:hypothetical protein MTR67_012826 [Solanum verrucosum]
MEMWERGYCEFTESDFHCSGHWGTLSSSVINKGAVIHRGQPRCPCVCREQDHIVSIIMTLQETCKAWVEPSTKGGDVNKVGDRSREAITSFDELGPWKVDKGKWTAGDPVLAAG